MLLFYAIILLPENKNSEQNGNKKNTNNDRDS